MAASQRDIRAFESEQQRSAAAPYVAPPEAADLPLVSEPPGTPTQTQTVTMGGGGTLPLGAKLPQMQTTSPSMDAAVQGILTGQQRLNDRLGPLQGRVDEKRAALDAELGQAMPPAPKLQDLPQFQPRQVNGDELALFGGIAMALAGLGTRAMRGDITTALNAAGNAMRGYNEGNLQQARLDLENFQMTMRGVIAQNHKMSEEYRAIIESRKMSLDQKAQALRVAASARDDETMLAALAQGQFKTVFDLEAHRINATNQVAQQATQIYNAALFREAELNSKREPLKPVQRPDGTVIYVPESMAAFQKVPDSNSNRPPPAEVMRMNIAVAAAGKALDNYEKLLKGFDPRSWDQIDPAQRATIESAISALQLEWKEAAALGALTGPDLEIMSRTLVSPASFKGAFYDRAGLQNQINEARGYFGRRAESIRQFYPGVDKSAAPRGGPAVGAVEGGYRFKGGDPSKRENWERTQ